MKRITPLLILVLLAFSCNDLKNNTDANEKLIALHNNGDDLKKVTLETSIGAKGQIATFLTFQKEDAEQAMNFYVGLFDNSEIVTLKRWGKEGPGKEGTIMHATFNLNGKLFMCSDSPPIHDWDFTPAVSNYVKCADERELEQLFTKLSENGKVMMPLGNYGFSQKFGFVEDRFGVSWQLNLD
ncbi:VOC family protein [Allomuricauda sp. d1]|uniref:VOC family protein n=1 Tax=Allomuricauda sp. d1 TaxID=3136725 RepID=UPI0031D3606E